MAWLLQLAQRFFLPQDDAVSPKEEVDNTFVYYHQVWRALQRGSSDSPNCSLRPPLPPELVRIIIRYAGFKVPDSALATATNACQVSSRGPRATKVWFWGGPLTDTRLARIAALQLVTVSRDQGWVSDPTAGSWSWFDIGVFPAPPPARTNSEIADRGSSAGLAAETDWSWISADIQNYFNDRDDGHWRYSHHNPMEKPEGRREGPIFAMDDDIWQDVKTGSIVAVRMCAQYPGWQNKGSRAELRTWRYFEPVIPM
ncbi:hypothetical protein EIP86_011150 [Pleurotus ostreatoroseus]|nr:hypothetical protein EIP86_011150 [Pleurotus ostreatoroseus]